MHIIKGDKYCITYPGASSLQYGWIFTYVIYSITTKYMKVFWTISVNADHTSFIHDAYSTWKWLVDVLILLYNFEE